MQLNYPMTVSVEGEIDGRTDVKVTASFLQLPDLSITFMAKDANAAEDFGYGVLLCELQRRALDGIVIPLPPEHLDEEQIYSVLLGPEVYMRVMLSNALIASGSSLDGIPSDEERPDGISDGLRDRLLHFSALIDLSEMLPLFNFAGVMPTLTLTDAK